ncbi:uncharacterized protein LOC112177744 [Rosa chinensis]|uniref:uncharacterized protein LOC112177744 n=1 Tax=Rosa chinensis TaxID=74649 RepID=UPI000D08C80B|nr:uncharacterized protein LOC112177744 [Rosa chinensis]
MQSRLDRAITSITWSDIFLAAQVLHLPPVHGDHIPILLGVFCGSSLMVERRRHYFKFESFWTFHEGYQNVVKVGWEPMVNGLPMQQVTRKITRFSLNHWQREFFGMRSREIGLLRDRLQTLFSLPLSSANQEDCSVLNAKLEDLLAKEDAYWKQQSKPKVTDDMNLDLCAPYSALEIRAALFQMYPTKAPEPDGMPHLFFQKYWELLRLKVIDDMNLDLCAPYSALETRAALFQMYPTKAPRAALFQMYPTKAPRPDDNSLVANEVSHFIHKCYSSTEGVFSLKLDMSNAYDRMEWSFLEDVLLRLGFAESWVGVIMKCVTIVRYTFLINGQPKGYLTPTRGLRQGDPHSPYMFPFCTEVFSALLEHKVVNGELQGIEIYEGTPTIHHLLFANDSLLFGKATLNECHHIQSVLHDYELAYGQHINLSKSSIIFSKRVSEDAKCVIACFLGVSIEAKHEKYLGLPTYLGRNRTEPFAYSKESLSKKLAGWQGNC